MEHGPKKSDYELFSRMEPSGRSMREPSLATMMTVPRRVMLRPNQTSPCISMQTRSTTTPEKKCSRTNRNSQMIQLEEVGNGAEPLLEVDELLESVTKLDDGGLGEHAVGVHDQLAMLEAVEIAGDQEQIGAALDLLRMADSDEISFCREIGMILTGKKRDRGTLTPWAPLKCLIAAPMAVSSWMTGSPLSATLLLTIMSSSIPPLLITR